VASGLRDLRLAQSVGVSTFDVWDFKTLLYYQNYSSLMISKICGLSIMAVTLSIVLYSSPALGAAADIYTMSCSYTKDKKTSFCSDNDPSNNDVWRCDKQKNGTWKCGKTVSQSSTSLPTDLKKGLDLAKTSAVNVTSTSPGKDFMSKKNELLKNDNQFQKVNPDEGSNTSSTG